jgi:hypothetical protein
MPKLKKLSIFCVITISTAILLSLSVKSNCQTLANGGSLIVDGDTDGIEALCPWNLDTAESDDGVALECGIQEKAPRWQLQIDSVNAIGAVDFNTSFSSQRSIEGLTQGIADETNFSANAGMTRIVAIAQSKQGFDETIYKKRIFAGYDPLGSQGLLVGSGTTSSSVLSDENFGWVGAVGFSNITVAGQLSSRVRVDAQSLERYFKSDSFGQVGLNASVETASENAQQTYTQSISVNGESSISQTTRFSFGPSLSDLCPWQRE